MPGIAGQPNVTPGGGISQVAADARYLPIDGSQPLAGDLSVLGSVQVAGVLEAASRAVFDAGLSFIVRTLTSNGTLTTGDYVVLLDATAGNVTATLPLATDSIGGGGGYRFDIKRVDASANTVTLAAAGADTIDGATTCGFSARQARTIQAISSSAWVIL